MKTMSATIQIAAPPMDVWAVLTDLSSYRDWNPLFREASGQVAAGNRIRLRSVHPANGRLMTVKPKITVAAPGAELRWTASLPGIMSGEHSFVLAEADGGRFPDRHATVGQALDKYLEGADLEVSTREAHQGYIRRTIGPVLGEVKIR